MPRRRSRSLRQTLRRRATAPNLSTIYEDRAWSRTDSDGSAGPADDPDSSRISEEALSKSLESYGVRRKNESRWARCNKWVSDLLLAKPDLCSPKGWQLWGHHESSGAGSTSLYRLRSSRSMNNLTEYYYNEDSRTWRVNCTNLSAVSLPRGDKQSYYKPNWLKRGTASLTTMLGVRRGHGFEDDYEDDYEDDLEDISEDGSEE